MQEQLEQLQFSPIESIVLPSADPSPRSIFELSRELQPLVRLYITQQCTEEQEIQCRALLDTLNQKRLYEFVSAVNLEITAFNKLIEQYNHAETVELKTTILQAISMRNSPVDARYPESVISRSPEYRTRFYDGLATEIRRNTEQIAQLDGTASMVVYPDRLAELLQKMSQKKLNRFLAILCDRTNYDDELEALYQPTDPEYAEFKDFLDTHSIVFAGGKNSNNFQIKRLKSKEPPYILKIENRVNQPKDIAQHLGATVDNLIKPKWSRRAYCLRKERGGKETILVRSITTERYFEEGSLYDYAMIRVTPHEKINAALTIYLQMAQVLNKIKDAGGVFPDMKNTNWLYDSGILLIGDDKSLRWDDGHGCVDVFSERSQWYGDLLKSPESMPPEVFKAEPISVDAFYAFSWAKNLYEFLVADPDEVDLAYQREMNGEDFNFNHRVFRMLPEGPLLKQLIIDMVQELPKNRITFQAGVERLAHIQLIRTVQSHIVATINPPLPYAVVKSYLEYVSQLAPEQIGPYVQITAEALNIEMQPFVEAYRDKYQAKFTTTIQKIETVLATRPNEDLRLMLIAAKMERQSLKMTSYEQFEADLDGILLDVEQLEMGMAGTALGGDSEGEGDFDDDQDQDDKTLR